MGYNLTDCVKVVFVFILFGSSQRLIAQEGDVVFWLKPETVFSADNVHIEGWSSSEGAYEGLQMDAAAQPIIEEAALNGVNGVSFDNSSFLNFSTDVNFVGGNKTFMILFNPRETNYGLFARGRAQSSDSQNGDFSIFPFSANFRIKWQEYETVFAFDFPNLATNQYYLLRFSLDHTQGLASVYIDEELIASQSCNVNYSFTTTNRTTLIGSYPSAPTFNFDGVIVESLLLSTVAETTIDSVLIEMGSRYIPSINLGSDIFLGPGDNCTFNLDAGSGFTTYRWSTGALTQSITVDEPGTYSVVAKGDYGLLTSDTIVIGFDETLIAQDQLLCSYDSLLWDLGLVAGFTYDWSDGLNTTNSSRFLYPGEIYSVDISNGNCSVTTPEVIVENDNYAQTVEIEEQALFCQGNSLFLSGGSGEAETYLWNTDAVTPSILPETDGQYWVEATNANGCVGIDTVDVVMAGVAPTVLFDVGIACATREVTFVDATEPEGGTIVEQNWLFGEDPDANGQGETVNFAFPVSGQFPVQLTVSLDNGCTGTKWDTVTVSPLPLVNFDYDAVIPCAGNEVAFESQSGVPGGGTIAEWHWRFSNGTEATGIVGSTTFEDLGTASVLHIVESSVGCTDSLDVPVVVLGSPIVDFAFDTVCVGTATAFQELVDVSESGSVFYQWQFGDGFFSNFPNTSHTYDSPGAYDVTLKATGNDFGNPGCVDQLTKTVRVYDSPTAVLNLQDACEGEGAVLVDLTEALVVDGESDPVVARNWAVALGPDITEEIGVDSVQLFFPGEAGTYPILFDFVTDAGCIGNADGLVDVLAIPTAAFTLDVPSSAPPVVVTVENVSTDAMGYTWYVNGEAVSNAVSPELLLPDTGSYTIGLMAENSLGCSDLVEETVAVIVPEYDLALLDVQFVLGPSTPLGDQRIQLTALLSNYGNTEITSFDMEVDIGKDINFTQTVDDVSITPGDVVYYPLGPDFEYLPPRTLPYSCMRVSNPNGMEEETDYENNEICVGLDKEKVTFIAPYPNPVSGVVHLGFVLPKAGEMEISFFSTNGKEVLSSTYNLEEGYTVIDYSVATLSEGLYVLQYNFEGEVQTERVVVTHVD